MNYALSIDRNDWVVFPVRLAPGIMDSWTETRGKSFQTLVAPRKFVHEMLNIESDKDVFAIASMGSIKLAILAFFFRETRTKYAKHSFNAQGDLPREDTEWEENVVYDQRG